MISRKLCNDAVSTAGGREWKVFRRKHNNAILNGACNQLNAAVCLEKLTGARLVK
jgi:hypothetical protein